jgi:hypothetical protein
LISWKISAALFFIKPWLDKKNKRRKESLGEKERKRQGGTQKLCYEKCFKLEINKKQ